MNTYTVTYLLENNLGEFKQFTKDFSGGVARQNLANAFHFVKSNLEARHKGAVWYDGEIIWEQS